MEEEEEIMMGADDRQIRKIKTAWKAAHAGPPALEASVGAIQKCKIPALNLPLPVAKLEKAFKPLEKKYSEIQSKKVKAAVTAIKSFQKAHKNAAPNKTDPPQIPARKEGLGAANISLLLEIDAILAGLSDVAKANIPLQNDFRKFQSDLKKASKEAGKEKDKKKTVSISVLGQSMEVKAGEVPKLISASSKLGTDLKAFDSALADLMSAWTRDRAALVAYRDKVKGFSPTKFM